MKRLLTIMLLVLVLAIAGCGGPAAEAETTTETGAAESKAEVKSDDSEESFTGSLTALMAKAVPMKCTWDYSFEGESVSGTVYVKGEKFYSDLRDSVDDPVEKEFYRVLASMEREHRLSLEDTYEYFKDPEGWYRMKEGHHLDGG